MHWQTPTLGPASGVRHICPETGELLWTEPIPGSPKMPAVSRETDNPRHAEGQIGNLMKGNLIMSIEIYTDGSCLGNPGPGGWGFVAYEDGKAVHEARGEEPATTNNRMEMIAIIKALEWLGPNRQALVKSDSQYAVNVFNRTYKAKLNLELVQIGRDLLDGSGAQLVWIRGHAGHPGNELADALARSGLPE